MNEKEKAVLYELTKDPGLLEKITINGNIFKGQSKDIFNELERQFIESQSFSEEIAADKLGLKISQIHALFDGCYRFDESRLEFMLKEIEAESLSKDLLIKIKKEMESELKTGTINKSENLKIEAMYRKRFALLDGECLSMDYHDVKLKDVKWLWSGRIPLGMITLIASHPGIGKSFFTTWLAAKLSKGQMLPDSNLKSAIKPCSTLLIAIEDDPECTIKARLKANDADYSKIIRLVNPMKFSLDSVRPLEKELDKNPDIKLIVLDPLTAFLGTKIDYFKDPDVRLKLIPLKELAEKRAISILGVVHFNKREDSDLITRIGGSMAFAGIARSVLGVSYDNRETDEDTRDNRLLSSLKMNLDRRPDTLAFKINSNRRIEFEPKPVMIDADTLFSKESREKKVKQSLTDIWLLDYLESHPNSTGREALKAASEESIPPASTYRAKSKLENQGRLKITETGFGKEHKSYWKLK